MQIFAKDLSEVFALDLILGQHNFEYCNRIIIMEKKLNNIHDMLIWRYISVKGV
jgi:hypothetical protein